MFQRKSKSKGVEAEIARLSERAAELESRLAAARVRLDEAREARRKFLIEAPLDDAKAAEAEARVTQAESAVSGLEDALAEVAQHPHQIRADLEQVRRDVLDLLDR